MRYSVVLLISNSIACEGLSRILQSEEFNVVAALTSSDDIALANMEAPDLAIIDVSTCEAQIDAVALIKKHLSCKTIVLAEQFHLSTMLECFSQGAYGYILKSMPWSTLIASLRLAALGHKIMPSELSDRLTRDMIQPLDRPAAPRMMGEANFSQREQEVLGCLIIGDANKIIARKLNLSEATVKIHVKAILRKLNVLNRTQAAIWAKSRGLGQAVQQIAA